MGDAVHEASDLVELQRPGKKRTATMVMLTSETGMERGCSLLSLCLPLARAKTTEPKGDVLAAKPFWAVRGAMAGTPEPGSPLFRSIITASCPLRCPHG